MSVHFGQPTQLGYVVHDLDAALEHWIEVLGIGPWYVFPRLELSEFEFRGEPSDLHVSIALANSGTLQIELIQQRNTAPSMYREFLESGHEGLQHISWWPEDYDRAMAQAEKAGWDLGQRGEAAGTRFAYFDTQSHAGTVVEIADLDERMRGFFAHIENEAANWDGSTKPIRVLGETPNDE